MTGGEALVASLVREGVRVIFGVPGVQLYGTLAALRDEPRIRFIATRHEQAAAYMADGYARAGGGIGVGLVVPGPGLLNTLAGLSTAYAASSPVLMIAGQIPRAAIGKGFGLLHEVIDQLDAVAPVTKWRRRVLDVASIPEAVREAMRQLRTGRPRPVEIEIPPDTMEEEGDAVLLDPAPAARPAADPAAVDAAAALLAGAARPVIYAGGGVHASGAHEALAAVAEFLQAGVVQSPEGKGAISDHHPLSLGAAVWPGSPLREHLDQADVVLAVGTRLAVGLDPAQQVVHIDIDPDEIGRAHPRTLGLAGDARSTLLALLAALRARAEPRASGERELATLRSRAASTGVLEPQASILRSLRAGTPEDAIVVVDMTQIGYYARPFWPVYAPRTYLTPSYSGNLGFAFPTALGAKVARPDRPVVAVVGDGGFLFNAQELATAVQHRINVVVALFNDHAYGNVARDMDESWGGTIGTDLHNPDFMTLAQAFGAAGLRARDPTEVGALVRQALTLDRPAIVEVPVGRMSEPPYRTPRQAPAPRRRR
ncbi:MAG: thiamine pyrophosphate-binding protein [Armatimonadota bacterium]|nr:thiamine pyrophosphate-binding protein [Armatimonadota bacterium]MDR7457000.1 thiamine pyrophosphate-binding protein [Armatimonadota bacterium]MDR7511109.1 thiamine pyrophosphate-binding protein [Armatimonadota bacterium]